MRGRNQLGFDIGLDIEFYFKRERRDEGEREREERNKEKNYYLLDPCQLLIFDATEWRRYFFTKYWKKCTFELLLDFAIIASSCRASNKILSVYISFVDRIKRCLEILKAIKQVNKSSFPFEVRREVARSRYEEASIWIDSLNSNL